MRPTARTAPPEPGRARAAPRLAPVLAALLLAGCGGGALREDGPPPDPWQARGVPDAVPRHEPPSRYGNPDSYVVFGRRYYTMKTSRGYTERGIASWYGSKFHGRRTSSGERYDMYAMTAAHRSLPLPSYVEVTNLENGRRAVVRVNDRGPFHANRIIDLSYSAASKLGIVGRGTGLVEVRAIDPGRPRVMPARYETPAPAPAPVPDVPAAADVPPGPPPALYLQAGAFSSRDNAERLKTRLHSVVEGAIRISEVAGQGGAALYRVRIGPLAGVEQADRLAETLTGAGIEDPHVVVE